MKIYCRRLRISSFIIDVLCNFTNRCSAKVVSWLFAYCSKKLWENRLIVSHSKETPSMVKNEWKTRTKIDLDSSPKCWYIEIWFEYFHIGHRERISKRHAVRHVVTSKWFFIFFQHALMTTLIHYLVVFSVDLFALCKFEK